MWNRVTVFELAGRVVRVIKKSFQKHLEKGMDTEAKIVPTGGVCDFLPPPLRKLIVHHGTYRDRG